MLDAWQDLPFGCAIGAEFIGHDHPGHGAQTLQQLAKETRGRLLVPAVLDQHIKYVAMLINSSPEIMQFASDANEHFIEKPFVTGLRPAPLKALSVGPSEAQAPLANGLVADHDTPRGQDQFDLSQAQAEAVIQPDRLVDDFSRKTEAR